MRVKQSDIARDLGLSQATVSRALRGHAGISREVTEQVRAAAEKAGYQPSNGSLLNERVIPRRPGVICVDIPRADEWHERLLDGIVSAAADARHEIITAVHSRGDLPQVVTRGQVDGMIRLMCQDDYRMRFNPVPRAPVPTVSIMFPVPGADVISVDHFESARRLGVRVGQSNPGIVAYVGHTEPIGQARMAGFRCGVQALGAVMPDALVRATQNLEFVNVLPLIYELLDLRATGAPEHQFSLIACYNDYFAGHAVRAVRDHGLLVPEDIGVVGYDDLGLAIDRDIKLTTVHLPLEELGAEAVRRVHWRMMHPDASLLHWLVETTVVDGNSVIGTENMKSACLNRSGKEEAGANQGEAPHVREALQTSVN